MAIETLVCAHEGHAWTREAKRGKKPHWCPEHRPAPAERKLSEPASGTRVPDDVLEILTSDEYVGEELRRKLEYCAIEVDRPGRDADSVGVLLERAKSLVREHRRGA